MLMSIVYFHFEDLFCVVFESYPVVPILWEFLCQEGLNYQDNLIKCLLCDCRRKIFAFPHFRKREMI